MEVASEVLLDYMQRVKERQNKKLPKSQTQTNTDSTSSVKAAYQQLLARLNQAVTPQQGILRKRIKEDGLRAATNEVRIEIDGVDSIAILATSSHTNSHVMYFIAFGNWQQSAIRKYDPSGA